MTITTDRDAILAGIYDGDPVALHAYGDLLEEEGDAARGELYHLHAGLVAATKAERRRAALVRRTVSFLTPAARTMAEACVRRLSSGLGMAGQRECLFDLSERLRDAGHPLARPVAFLSSSVNANMYADHSETHTVVVRHTGEAHGDCYTAGSGHLTQWQGAYPTAVEAVIGALAQMADLRRGRPELCGLVRIEVRNW